MQRLNVKIFYSKFGEIIYYTTNMKDKYNNLPFTVKEIDESQLKELRNYYLRLSNFELVPREKYYYQYDATTGEIIYWGFGGAWQHEPFIILEEEIKDVEYKRISDGLVVSKSESEITALNAAKEAEAKIKRAERAIELLKEITVLNLAKSSSDSLKVADELNTLVSKKQQSLDSVLAQLPEKGA